MVIATRPTTTPGVHRIHIIGGPGSGKTRLAHELHNATGLPHLELDLIAEPGQPPRFLPPRPLDERKAAVHEIASTSAWITEGSSALWTTELLAGSEIIIWLDVERREAIPRVVRRHLGEYIADIRAEHRFTGRLRAARHPHLKALAAFVRYAWSYYDHKPLSEAPSDEEECSRSSAAWVLAPLAAKTLRYSRAPALAAVLYQLAFVNA